jgi:uncharacterized protein (DUF488 family)
MYYRRKLLLALLEVFDGNLDETDCELLLFHVCQATGKQHYDFFPHHAGPFSFLSVYDKRRLGELGLLKTADDFQIQTTHSSLEELTPADRSALFALKTDAPRGRQLLRQTCQQYPQFAARCKILADIFDPEEIRQLQFAWNMDTRPFLFTLGYEGLTIDAFLYKLIANNVMALVDVRNNPQSMKYGFSKKSFKDYVEKAGVKYIHIPALGIPSALRKGLGTSVLHEKLFQKYETEILPKQEEAQQQLLDLIAETPRTALVCFEADHHLCHRHTLVEHLRKKKAFNRIVIHLS